MEYFLIDLELGILRAEFLERQNTGCWFEVEERWGWKCCVVEGWLQYSEWEMEMRVRTQVEAVLEVQ